jgi:GxxExxY protein
MVDDQYKYSELTSKIIGCTISVHKTLGYGFQEVIYQMALENLKCLSFTDKNKLVRIELIS